MWGTVPAVVPPSSASGTQHCLARAPAAWGRHPAAAESRRGPGTPNARLHSLQWTGIPGKRLAALHDAMAALERTRRTLCQALRVTGGLPASIGIPGGDSLGDSRVGWMSLRFPPKERNGSLRRGPLKASGPTRKIQAELSEPGNSLQALSAGTALSDWEGLCQGQDLMKPFPSLGIQSNRIFQFLLHPLPSCSDCAASGQRSKRYLGNRE